MNVLAIQNFTWSSSWGLGDLGSHFDVCQSWRAYIHHSWLRAITSSQILLQVTIIQSHLATCLRQELEMRWKNTFLHFKNRKKQQRKGDVYFSLELTARWKMLDLEVGRLYIRFFCGWRGRNQSCYCILNIQLYPQYTIVTGLLYEIVIKKLLSGHFLYQHRFLVECFRCVISTHLTSTKLGFTHDNFMAKSPKNLLPFLVHRRPDSLHDLPCVKAPNPPALTEGSELPSGGWMSTTSTRFFGEHEGLEP